MKNKKLLIALLSATCAVTGAFGLAACSKDEGGGNNNGGNDVHSHSWSDWTVETKPTEDAEGKATRTCSGNGDCDAAAEDKERTLPTLESADYSKGADTATCSAAGSMEYTYNKGGVNVSFTVTTSVSTEAHDYGAWAVTKDPTAETEGTVERVCKHNGEHKEPKTLPVLTEENYTVEVTKDATCSAKGEAIYTLKADNTITVTVATDEDPEAHDYGAWAVTHKPTAEAEGTAERVCNHNGEHRDTKTLPVLTEENYTVVSTKDATCTELSATVYALNEDETVTVTVESPALGHIYVMDSSVVEDRNYAKFTCTRCNLTVSEDFVYDDVLIDGGAGTSPNVAVEINSDLKTYYKQVNAATSQVYKLKLSAVGNYSFELDNILPELSSKATFGTVVVDDGSGKKANVIGRTGVVTSAYAGVCKITATTPVNNRDIPTAFTFAVTEADVTAQNYIYFVIMPYGATEATPAYFTFTVDHLKTLSYGENTVSITDTYLMADSTNDLYTYVPTADGVQSITVPEGVEGLAVSIIDGANVIGVIDAASEKYSANFNVTANQPVVFAFVAGVKGSVKVTIGEEIEDPRAKELSLTNPVAVTLEYQKPIEIVVSQDVTEGEYLIVLGLDNVGTRNAYSIKVNDGTAVSYQAGGNDYRDKFTVKGGDIVTAEILSRGTPSNVVVMLMPVVHLGLGEEGALTADFAATSTGSDVYPELSADITSGTYKITVTGVEATNTAPVYVSVPGGSLAALTNTDGVASATVTLDFANYPQDKFYIRCYADITLKVVLEKVEAPAA